MVLCLCDEHQLAALHCGHHMRSGDVLSSLAWTSRLRVKIIQNVKCPHMRPRRCRFLNCDPYDLVANIQAISEFLIAGNEPCFVFDVQYWGNTKNPCEELSK